VTQCAVRGAASRKFGRSGAMEIAKLNDGSTSDAVLIDRQSAQQAINNSSVLGRECPVPLFRRVALKPPPALRPKGLRAKGQSERASVARNREHEIASRRVVVLERN